MNLLITGSSGHLGEALVRHFREAGHRVTGMDLRPSDFTDVVGSITDRALVRRWMTGMDGVVHAATLHQPHVATHEKSRFVDVNVTGTLHLLEAAVEHSLGAFVFTSTTSVFGHAMAPTASGATWVTEDLSPSRATSTASRSSPLRNCARSSVANADSPASCCARPGSFRKRTTRGPTSHTRTSRRTNTSIGAWTSRISPSRTTSRSGRPAPSASAATS